MSSGSWSILYSSCEHATSYPLLSVARASSSFDAASSASNRAFSWALADSATDSLAAFQLLWSAGVRLTCTPDRSRTLIWLETCRCTSGNSDSYSPWLTLTSPSLRCSATAARVPARSETPGKRKARGKARGTQLQKCKTHGIMLISPICSFSWFSEMASTTGWSCASMQKRRCCTSCTPRVERFSAV